MTTRPDNIERRWARAGVLLNCTPSRRSPDLERLLLDTARRCPENARLLPLAATWLVEYGQFVARHRLRRLAIDELEAGHRPALGLLIDAAVAHGATRELLVVSDVCGPAAEPGPLSLVERSSPVLRAVSERNASELSRRWGVWAPEVEPKFDAVRPAPWLLARNPDYRDRIARKGDLRVSILETLRRDAPGHMLPSEVALTRLSGATRTAVRKALVSLQREGLVTVGRGPLNNRDHPVALRDAG